MRSAPLLVLMLSACDQRTVPPSLSAPAWVYAPEPIAWPPPPPHARIGRSEAPQPVASLGIRGPAGLAPLRSPTLWQLPDRAYAAVYAQLGPSSSAIELIDIDAGRVLWRDTSTCTGPIAGVTAEAIVCFRGAGVVALSLAGKKLWENAAPFVAFTDERIALIEEGATVVVDANDGNELARVPMRELRADRVVATCGDAGHEVFAEGEASTVVRIVEGAGDKKGTSTAAWTSRSPFTSVLESIDACVGDSILVLDGSKRLSSFRRSDGVRTGYVDGVRGWWPAPSGGGRIEIATDVLASWPRDLSAPIETLAIPGGELLATSGSRRLVRVTDETAAILDDKGLAGYVPLRGRHAALGTTALIAADWIGYRSDVVRRYALPPRLTGVPRITRASQPVTLPAELRDLPPAVQPVELVTSTIMAHVDSEAAFVALDPGGAVAANSGAPLVAFDLSAKRVRWQRADGCGGSKVVGLAITAHVVVCAAFDSDDKTGGSTASVRATSLADGAARWEWRGTVVDDVLTQGDIVVVIAGDLATVLDATGTRRGYVSSMVALVPSPSGVYIVTVEHGRLVARDPRLDFIGVWSIAIDGMVTRLRAAGDGVLLELADGDAYRVTNTGVVTALPGLVASWEPGTDVIASVAPAAGVQGTAPDRPVVTVQGKPAIPEPMPDADAPQPPRLWVPITPPAPISPAQQVTLYELGGGVLARNDYGVGPSTIAVRSARGPVSSTELAPLVVATQTAGGVQALVVDPRTGDPLRRVVLPANATLFSTVVGGRAITGAVVTGPLRVVAF